ncbi:MAG: proteasome assembly chaperone family protein [Candidatus Micrarchaeaceae archaeon]
MEKTKIFYDKKIKLKNPTLLVGLPGIGSVGSLVAEHIKNETKAQKFGVLYSPFFPPHVIMEKNGTVRMLSNRLYHFKNKKGNSIIILLGDTQPITTKGQYAVNGRVAKFFKKIGGKTVYTVGGYNISNSYVEKPRVFGVASSTKIINKLKNDGIIFGNASGSIFGAAGLLPVLSSKFGLDSACIMGETGLLEIDANAAKAVLEKLNKVLEINISPSNLDKIKKETEKLMKELEDTSKQNPEQLQGMPQHKDNLTYIR